MLFFFFAIFVLKRLSAVVSTPHLAGSLFFVKHSTVMKIELYFPANHFATLYMAYQNGLVTRCQAPMYSMEVPPNFFL